MRKLAVGALAFGVAVVLAPSTPGYAAAASSQGDGAAAAAAGPAEFGSDWDDPRTAAPPVATPPTASCTTTIVDTEFRNFTPFTGTYTPPAECAGPWNRVVLQMDGAVAGRQFDRLGSLRIGDVTVFTTSTPEPSPEGIRWSVQKDVTEYAALLRQPQPVWMLIGNVVDDTFTGVLDIQVHLTFYRAEGRFGPASTATDVLPLTDQRQQDGDRIGTVTVPRNTERLAAQVYATGSGGGCEEFWYLAAPPSSGYSCPADRGPYREVQVLVDGDLAGIAMPYPHVYTGGWSNPFLWAVLPAPRAFDIAPITYDLTPFVGRLTDGQPHTVAVRVVGVPAGLSGWDSPVNMLAWRDSGSTQVTGDLLTRTESPLRNDSTVSQTAGEHRVDTLGGHEFRAVGRVRTSHGEVVTTVEQQVSNQSVHRWADGENPDGLTATWTDHSTVTASGPGQSTRRTAVDRSFGMDGQISIGADNRLTTTITLTDAADRLATGGPGAGHSTLTDTYTGEATWTLDVPRDQRHAVGTTSERYRTTGAGRSVDHTIATTNGRVTTDTCHC